MEFNSLVPYEQIPEIFRKELPIKEQFRVIRLSTGQELIYSDIEIKVKQCGNGLKVWINDIILWLSVCKQIVVLKLVINKEPTIIMINAGKYREPRSIYSNPDNHCFIHTISDYINRWLPVNPELTPTNYVDGNCMYFDMTLTIEGNQALQTGVPALIHLGNWFCILLPCGWISLVEHLVGVTHPVKEMDNVIFHYPSYSTTEGGVAQRVIETVKTEKAKELFDFKTVESYDASEPSLAFNGCFQLFPVEGPTGGPSKSVEISSQNPMQR